MNFSRWLPYLFVLGRASQNASNDPLMAVVGALLGMGGIELAFFVGNIIWCSRFNIPTRVVAIIGFVAALGGTIYGSIYFLGRYRFEKQIQTLVPEEQLKELHAAYQAHKAMNFSQLTSDSCRRIKANIDDGNVAITALLDELYKINEIFKNPFVSEGESAGLSAVRNVIVTEIRDSARNAKDPKAFLRPFEIAEKMQACESKINSDPDGIVLRTILVEKGPAGYLAHLEKLCETEAGRKILERVLSTDTVYIELLENSVNEIEDFERFTDIVLSLAVSATGGRLTEADVLQYKTKCLPKLLKSLEGRNKVIGDIKPLYEISSASMRVILDIIKEHPDDIDALSRVKPCQVQERTRAKVSKIIQEFKTNLIQ